MQGIHHSNRDLVEAFNSISIDKVEAQMVLLPGEEMSTNGVQIKGVHIEKCCLAGFDKDGSSIVVCTKGSSRLEWIAC